MLSYAGVLSIVVSLLRITHYCHATALSEWSSKTVDAVGSDNYVYVLVREEECTVRFPERET